jgi:hypothetical protein
MNAHLATARTFIAQRKLALKHRTTNELADKVTHWVTEASDVDDMLKRLQSLIAAMEEEKNK